MNASDKEILIDKVRKLFALANGTSFEGEAAAAMERARAMLSKHGLTEDEVRVEEDPILEEPVEVGIRPPHWVQKLSFIIGDYYSCVILRFWMDRHFLFVGTDKDVAIATYAFTFLVRIVKGMVKKLEIPEGTRSPEKYRRSYAFGVIRAIQQKLNLPKIEEEFNDIMEEEIRKESAKYADSDDEVEKSLVVAKKAELAKLKLDRVQKYLEEKRIVKRQTAKSKIKIYDNERDAYALGAYHGVDIQLREGVTQKKSPNRKMITD